MPSGLDAEDLVTLKMRGAAPARRAAARATRPGQDRYPARRRRDRGQPGRRRQPRRRPGQPLVKIGPELARRRITLRLDGHSTTSSVTASWPRPCPARSPPPTAPSLRGAWIAGTPPPALGPVSVQRKVPPTASSWSPASGCASAPATPGRSSPSTSRTPTSASPGRAAAAAYRDPFQERRPVAAGNPRRAVVRPRRPASQGADRRRGPARQPARRRPGPPRARRRPCHRLVARPVGLYRQPGVRRGPRPGAGQLGRRGIVPRTPLPGCAGRPAALRPASHHRLDPLAARRRRPGPGGPADEGAAGAPDPARRRRPCPWHRCGQGYRRPARPHRRYPVIGRIQVPAGLAA